MKSNLAEHIDLIPDEETRRFLTPRHAGLLLDLLNRTGNEKLYGKDWDEYRDTHTHSRLRVNLDPETLEAVSVTYFHGKSGDIDSHRQVFLTHTASPDDDVSTAPDGPPEHETV